MKKLLAIMVLGLLFSGCAKPIGNDTNLSGKKEYRSITNLQPQGFADVTISIYSLGLISPKYYDFYEFANTLEEAEKNSMEACMNFRSKKGWEKNSKCFLEDTIMTTKGYIEKSKRVKVKEKKDKEVKLVSMIDKAKNTCKSLGFKDGTDKYTDCALKLYTQSVELAGQRNQTVVVPQNSGSNTMTIYDPVRDNDALMRRGQGLVNGTCTLGDLSNC